MSKPDHAAATLSIGEAARRTGLGPETLPGLASAGTVFPSRERLPAGHRRYSERDLQRLGVVLEGRAAGLSVAAAIRRALAAPEAGPVSIFAELRRTRPEMAPRRLGRSTC